MPFDVGRCAAACTAQSNYNIAHPPSDGSAPMLCRFFNTYNLLKNGIVQSQVCAMYSETWGSSYAVNTGYSSSGATYTIQNSVTYSNTADPGVCVPLACGYTAGKLFTLSIAPANPSINGHGTASIDPQGNGRDEVQFSATGPKDPLAAKFYLDSQCHLHTISGSVMADESANQDPSATGTTAYNYFSSPSYVASVNAYQPTCRVATDGSSMLTCVGATGNQFFACFIWWRIGVNPGDCGTFTLAVTAV